MSRWPAVLVAAACAGCATGPPRSDGELRPLELAAVPFFAQQKYACGPAALATVLGASGVAVEPDSLVGEVYLPARRGSLQDELLAAARRHGRLAYELRPERAALDAELDAGHPVLVLQNFGSRGSPRYHYAVVIGRERGRVLLRSGITKRLALAESRFAATWGRADRWAVVVLRPGELPAGAEAPRYMSAAAALEMQVGPAAAREAYEAATRRWPDEPGGWFGLGNAAVHEQHPADAEAAYRTALKVAPGYAAARNNLASLLADRGCLGAARAAVERAAADAAGTSLEPLVATTRTELAGRRAAQEPGNCPRP